MLTVACKKSYTDIFCFVLLPGTPHLKCKAHLIWIQTSLTYSRLKLENACEWLSNTSLSNSRKKYQPGVTQAILRRYKFYNPFQKKSLLENKCLKHWWKKTLFRTSSFKKVFRVIVRWKLFRKYACYHKHLSNMHTTRNLQEWGCCLFVKTLPRLTWKTLCTSHWILRKKNTWKILQSINPTTSSK